MKPQPADEHGHGALKSSSLERAFDTWLARFGPDLPKPVAQHRFHPTRKWRLDQAWPDLKVGVELQGGIWNKGAHVRGKGYINDCDKTNAAQILDWIVLWLTTSHLENDPEAAIDLIRQAIEKRKEERDGQKG